MSRRTLRILALSRRAIARGVLVGVSVMLFGKSVWAAPPKRARPPQFSPSVKETFFPDARQQLQGPRPARAITTTTTPASPSKPDPAGGSGETTRGWSKLISPEVLEDEIKSRQMMLAEAVQSPLKFKGGTYQKARAQLSLLATLFAITAEHDDAVRWKREAASMRDRLSRAGFNCKVGTDQSYSEAKARLDELDGLVRGDGPAQDEASGEPAWPAVADRQQLMQRLEESVEGDLSRWTANAPDFSRHHDQASHEAQLVAALAEVIASKGYDSADDETYRQHASAMQRAAVHVRQAAEQHNYEQARTAVGEIKKACSNCHEGFRD